VSSKTLIFDEVDAGIGGQVADVVGTRLRELGADFQVLCITHLPQIAARASTQFRIEKSVRGDRTVTSVERLDDQGRVEEISRMIGGASVTEPVRASARDLLAGSAATSSRGNRRIRSDVGWAPAPSPSVTDGGARASSRGARPTATDPAKAKAKGESESRWRRNT
jgi:DNA repair protein RecN (Recombination protein N)